MIKLRNILLLSALLFCFRFGYAQESEAAVINFSIGAGEQIKVGDEVQFLIEVTPKTDWKIYSAIPSEEEVYMPAGVSYDITSEGFEAAEKMEEEGPLVRQMDDVMGGTVRYYKRKVIFSQSIKITSADVLIAGTFDYMACNEFKCIPLGMDFKLRVKATE